MSLFTLEIDISCQMHRCLHRQLLDLESILPVLKTETPNVWSTGVLICGPLIDITSSLQMRAPSENFVADEGTASQGWVTWSKLHEYLVLGGGRL